MKPSDIRILAVDDEEMMLDAISNLFRSFQFSVDTASSGNKAWEMFKKNNYNMVISDIRMPDGDGLELAKKIKAHGPTSILFISGFSDILNEEIYHHGVEGVFSKPFDSSAVKKAIQSCFLAPEVKWAIPMDVGKMLQIQKSGNEIKDLENQKAVLFGRGGFFISYPYNPPTRGSSIYFTIEILSPTPVLFYGVGVVKWILGAGNRNAPPGLGIEIISMPSDKAQIYQQLFGSLLPYIPSPRRV